MKPFILGAVFARGGSKGIPGKNIKPLAGKPLMAYAIEAGLAVSLIDKMIVSTDDEEIASVARKYGAQIPFMRPSELAGDDSPEILSWQHAVKHYEIYSGRKVDILVSIPTTSPLRKAEDIERAIQKLLETDADAVITVTEAGRNPYFNMVTIDQDQARLVMDSSRIQCRQQAPEVYDMTTVSYACRADFIRRASSLFDGNVRAVIVPRERALDIDTPLDFEMAEFLMTRRDKRI